METLLQDEMLDFEHYRRNGTCMSATTFRVVEQFDVVKDVASGALAMGVGFPANPLTLPR
jgi:hypothetical protein